MNIGLFLIKCQGRQDKIIELLLEEITCKGFGMLGNIPSVELVPMTTRTHLGVFEIMIFLLLFNQ